jgi:hypothetical protein
LGLKLKLEVEDIVLGFIDTLREITTLRSSSLTPTPPLSSSTSSASRYDDLLTLSVDSVNESSPSSPPKHRIVKRTSSDDVTPSLSL